MNALDKIREWIGKYPDFDILKHFRVDYIDRVPATGGIYPAGLVEIARQPDIVGNVTVTNQYNFSLYYCFAKATEDDVDAEINADWISGFQEWIQEQSATGQAPIFGDVPIDERITAQNGVLYEADDRGTATYMVQLSVRFKRIYKTTNPWYRN